MGMAIVRVCTCCLLYHAFCWIAGHAPTNEGQSVVFIVATFLIAADIRDRIAR